MYVARNIAEFASTRETSNEIAAAIFELAPEGDESRMWAEPTAAESAAVITRAWNLADPETDCLYWGVETIRR